MKKLGLLAAGLMLGMGLIAYAASSGDGRKQEGKVSCDPSACKVTCDKTACDTTLCKVVCLPSSCTPRNK